MTLNVEEFPLSKSTSVSLCDTEVSLSQVVQKSNRAFDVTESILHTRANSYTRKVYEAFKDNQDMLGTVSIKPGIIDLSKLTEEIKLKVADELTRNSASYKALVDKYKAKHAEYFSNSATVSYYSALDALNEDPENETLQTNVDNALTVLNTYRETLEHTPTSSVEVTNVFDNFKKELDKHNKDKLEQYLYNEDSLKAKVKQLEVLEKKENKTDADKELIKILQQARTDLDKFNSLSTKLKQGFILLQSKQKEYLDKSIQDIKCGTYTYDLGYAYYLYALFIDLMISSGVVGLTDARSLASILLAELTKAKALYDSLPAYPSLPKAKASYIILFNSYISNPNFLTPDEAIPEHEPKVTGISYYEPDVNFHAFKYLQQIFGHSTLQDGNTRIGTNIVTKNTRGLVEFTSTNIDEKCPFLIEAKYKLGLLVNNPISESLEFVLPNKKINHVIYSFRLGNVYSYGYLTEEDFTYEFSKPIKLNGTVIPYIPIKESGVMLPSEKRLDELPLKYEEILRKCYIPYYELDKNISELLKSKITTSTEDSYTTKPYSNYNNNIGLQLGIPTNTQSKACCKYLVELFKDIAKYSKKEDFDKWIPEIYIPKTILQFNSETCLTEIGFSYIEIKPHSGNFKPVCKIISGDTVEIKYEGINQKGIPLGINDARDPIATHINGNKLFYDSSVLLIGAQTSKDEYTEVIVHGFTYTNTLNPNRPLEAEVNNTWKIGTYLSTNYDTSKYKEYRKVTDTVRNVFGKYTNDSTTDVVVVKGQYYDYAKEKLSDTKVIEPKDISLCSVVIPLFYYDIFDKESDYHKKKMYNDLESIYYDSINLIISTGLTIKQYDPFDESKPNEFITKKLRTKTLMSYLDYFINNEPEEVYKRKKEEDKTTYELFRDKNYVGIGLTYYRAIPKRNTDKNINPVFLPLQKKRELEVKKQLSQSTTINLYQDKNSHINNALTGVYKPKVLIEPLINIGDKYNKPMFNN